MQTISVVLVEPQHPGNIGAAARAMKTMGLTRLTLVAPRQFPHHTATARAAGADQLLADARVVADLPTALASCHHVYALSARTRQLAWPVLTAREAGLAIYQQASTAGSQVALVFGRESSGLTNEELACCHNQIMIPSIADFSSLNLAAAVQVVAYEVRMAMLSTQSAHCQLSPELPPQRLPATQCELNGFYQQLEQILALLGILDPNHPRLLLRRYKRLFSRAQLDAVELNILRGLLTAINKRIVH